MAGTSSDWVEILEPRSRERMYVNLASGECGWEPPVGAPVRQADGNQWWELFDPHSGRFYYYNSVGRRTVWHRPQGGDIVPLSQLQAMKRSKEAKRAALTPGRQQPQPQQPQHPQQPQPPQQHGSISSVGSQGRRTPLSEPPRAPDSGEREREREEPDSVEAASAAAAESRSQGDGSSSTEYSSTDGKEPLRDTPQRWQPPPGSKAAMLVKVNSMSRSQTSPSSAQQSLQQQQQQQQQQHSSTHISKASTFTLHPAGSKSPGGTQGYKTAPSSKMSSSDPRQAHHLRKGSNGSFCLVMTESHPSPLLLRSQSGTPRPASPPYGCTAPLYDDPVSECPIYDEPPMDMEVEGAHVHNNNNHPGLTRLTPTHSLQKPRLLQHPGPPHMGSRHKRNPSESDYSPAGLECIKHMVNVDPKQGHLSQVSPGSTRTPSPTARPDALLPQQQAPPRGPSGRDREPAGTPGPNTLEKKQSWRALEATVQRAMEARHSRQSSQASQDFPPPSTPQPPPIYQDSGYSTGPSPSLRRKSRRRTGAAGAAGGTGGRPGSVGSSGELSALNERLMAEMREVVSRSNTMREVRAGLDPELGSERVGVAMPRTLSPVDGGLRWYGGAGGAGGGGAVGGGSASAGRCSSREDLASAALARSISRVGHQSNPTLSPLELPGRQKRTYEKVDTLEKSITSQASLSSPETPGPASQTGTLELQAQLDSRKKGMADGRTASLGPHRPPPAPHDSRGAGDGGEGRPGGSAYTLSYATLMRQPPPPDMGMEDWASKHLNMHTQGLFRRRVSIANMLSWNRSSIKKPMLVTSNRAVRKEACEMFKLVQAYMCDRPSRLDRRHCALLIVTKCWDLPGLRDELYVQLVRQTTANTGPQSLAAGWELMAVSLAFFAPSPKFRCYLEGYIQRHTEPTSDKKLTQFILEQQELKLKKNSKSRKKRKQNADDEEGLPISTYAKFCYRKLQKVAITGGKKSELFPDRKLPWVQVQLSQYVLALGGAQTEGIFRVPGDIDEVNALKLQVVTNGMDPRDTLSDPNVPSSLMKLWYRELEEPLIPMNFYKQCVSNYDDPMAAIDVVQSLPELNRLVLCYFIHFLQVFAQPTNVSVTKMDVNNLAMVMAPNCLRCQSDDPRIIFENTRKEMSFLRMLIVHLDTSFVEGMV
ncbi:hypothetical protein CRUP_028532 [Coryphaenoides rupestris]|nr:hypothetical protein CRUP_028532 [Coryphaenoides rupestris]